MHQFLLTNNSARKTPDKYAPTQYFENMFHNIGFEIYLWRYEASRNKIFCLRLRKIIYLVYFN